MPEIQHAIAHAQINELLTSLAHTLPHHLRYCGIVRVRCRGPTSGTWIRRCHSPPSCLNFPDASEQRCPLQAPWYRYSFGRNLAKIGSKHPGEGKELTVLDTLAGLTAIFPPH